MSEAAIIAISGSSKTVPADREPAAWIERAQQGDVRAFEHLMRVHEKRVVGTAWRLLGRLEDAQDAAQEVFLRLYRYLDRFDPTRGALEPWLYRVTVNVCRDLGRKRRVREAVSLEDTPKAERLESTAPDPAVRAGLAEEQRIAEAAIASLPPKERAALVLRDVEGLSTREVAEILGSSEVTVRTHICRARLKIKKFRDRKFRRTDR